MISLHWNFFSFFLNLLLSSMTVAMKAQPRWEAMDRMDVFYVGTALIIVGTVLVVSSFLALGFTGTFLGTYQTTRRRQSFTDLIRLLQFCWKNVSSFWYPQEDKFLNNFHLGIMLYISLINIIIFFPLKLSEVYWLNSRE